MIFSASKRCASATKLPRSRPRTLALTVMRRWPHSRVIVLGPSTTSIFAKRDSGMRWPVGVEISMEPMVSGLCRNRSGIRMMSGNRNWPSIASLSGSVPTDSINSSTLRACTP